ncbi:hypothetical protein [Xanthomonas campestris]|uniref:hypothetical protein n=1 Tax=Xanthomonas campestris TaxID=339 RepID=UPI00388ECFD2
MNALAVRWNDWPITRKSLAVVTLPLLLVERILQKLEVKDRTQAAVYAVHAGLAQ